MYRITWKDDVGSVNGRKYFQIQSHRPVIGGSHYYTLRRLSIGRATPHDTLDLAKQEAERQLEQLMNDVDALGEGFSLVGILHLRNVELRRTVETLSEIVNSRSDTLIDERDKQHYEWLVGRHDDAVKVETVAKCRYCETETDLKTITIYEQDEHYDVTACTECEGNFYTTYQGNEVNNAE